MASSALSDYMQTYGSRLQSMLHSPVEPRSPLISSLQQSPGEGSAIAQGAPQAPGMAPPQASEQGTSFAQLWQQTPQDQRKQFADRLEESLKKGNQTIDSAYDEMIRQLGQRPSGKLSREDKGALLMEFGLSLMANSARNKYGDDLGGAIGASGLQTLGRYHQMTHGRQREYDEKVAAINAGRAKAKSALAEAMAKEGIQGESTLAKAEMESARRANEIAGTVTSESGDVFGYTKSGRASALKDEQGQPIKERQKSTTEPLVPVLDESGNEVWLPRSQAIGKQKRPPESQLDKPFGLKAADTNAIYRQAAGLFGGMYDPITGRIAGLNREQAELVQKIASRASQLYMEGGGKVDHATAVDKAFEEARSGKLEQQSASEPQVPPDATRKTVGGKRYVKIGDTWYEED